jgi:hypothetical protein
VEEYPVFVDGLQKGDEMSEAKKRGRPKGTGTGRRPGAHIDVLAEVVLYGRCVLKMTDAAMAAELGYSREFIRQARARKMGARAFRCKAGHLLPPGRFVYCAVCDPDPLAKADQRILCLRPGCKRTCYGGECSQCRANRRYKEDPRFRKKHNAATASWSSRNRRKVQEMNVEARARYEMRRAAGWTMFDPMRD